jgi:hypothetical protein
VIRMPWSNDDRRFRRPIPAPRVDAISLIVDLPELATQVLLFRRFLVPIQSQIRFSTFGRVTELVSVPEGLGRCPSTVSTRSCSIGLLCPCAQG